MLMDLGFGESLSGGRATAYAVIVLEIILVIAVGVWLW